MTVYDILPSSRNQKLCCEFGIHNACTYHFAPLRSSPTYEQQNIACSSSGSLGIGRSQLKGFIALGHLVRSRNLSRDGSNDATSLASKIPLLKIPIQPHPRINSFHINLKAMVDFGKSEKISRLVFSQYLAYLSIHLLARFLIKRLP